MSNKPTENENNNIGSASYLDMMVTYKWNSWFGLGFNSGMTNTNMVII